MKPAPTRDSKRGALLAIAAYIAWGFLSPVGQILVQQMGPFTANAIRTLGSIPFLLLLTDRKKIRIAFRSVGSDLEVWLLGGGFLALCLVPYLASLKYLPPSITTLTVYLTPLLVAGWMWSVHGERPSRLLVPAVAAILGGGYLAVQAPGGAPGGSAGAVGLLLAILGVLGWTAYTLHLKALSRTRDADALTLAAFLTSGATFLGGAFAFEGFEVSWTPGLERWIALYILVPSVLSFFLYSRALQLSGATTIAVLLGIELVSTAIIAFYLTGEEFSPAKAIGMVIVLVAVTAYLWDERRRTRQTSLASDS